MVSTPTTLINTHHPHQHPSPSSTPITLINTHHPHQHPSPTGLRMRVGQPAMRVFHSSESICSRYCGSTVHSPSCHSVCVVPIFSVLPQYYGSILEAFLCISIWRFEIQLNFAIGGSLRNTPSPKDKRASPSTPSSGATLSSPSPPAVPSPDSAPAPAEGGLEKRDGNKLNEELQVPSTPNGNSDLTSLNTSNSPFTTNYYTGNHNYNTTSAGLSVIEHNRFDYSFKPHLKTVDKNCYECKVRYRDPKPKDLVMFLHALKYSGPGWHFETKMPEWAASDWVDTEDD
ncbi:hypothetical protein FHG87_018161 [Trinorchestia longiramus]|nr:hypothetical protein FHG87_018161 [Trinorchestia longiramus]